MSVTFTKLFSSITESTVWTEDDQTRIVWITMLAMADRKGRVWGSVPGLANRARVSLEDCVRALDRFMSPDEWSRTKDNDGRRVIEIDGGWYLLNFDKYRAIRDEETIKETNRNSMRKSRAKKKVDTKTHSVPPCSQAEAEAEADQNKQPPKSPKGGRGAVDYQSFMDTWNSNIEGTPFPKIVAMTDKRKKAISDLLKDCPDAISMLVPVINHLSGIEFFTGHNDREWIASFDYLLQKGKLVEYYEKSKNKQKPTVPDKVDLEIEQMRREYDAARAERERVNAVG